MQAQSGRSCLLQMRTEHTLNAAGHPAWQMADNVLWVSQVKQMNAIFNREAQQTGQEQEGQQQEGQQNASQQHAARGSAGLSSSRHPSNHSAAPWRIGAAGQQVCIAPHQPTDA